MFYFRLIWWFIEMCKCVIGQTNSLRKCFCTCGTMSPWQDLFYCVCVSVSVVPLAVGGWVSVSDVVWWFMDMVSDGRLGVGGGWICATTAKIQITQKQTLGRTRVGGNTRTGRVLASKECYVGCSVALQAKWNRLQNCHNQPRVRPLAPPTFFWTWDAVDV